MVVGPENFPQPQDVFEGKLALERDQDPTVQRKGQECGQTEVLADPKRHARTGNRRRGSNHPFSLQTTELINEIERAEVKVR